MKRLFIVLNCLVLAMASVVLIPAFALAEVPSSYTSYGYASGVHAIGGSDAFPNFQNGAVNNRYPLAEVQQDASPSTAAVATYSDSGPLSATAGSQYNQGCMNSGSQPPPPQICQNPNNQVPYAKANYPGPTHGHVDNCNGCDGGARADADAAQLTANSSAYYAGGGTQPFSGAWGQTKTVIDSGGNLTVTTHSEVDSFGFGTFKVSKIAVDVTANSSLSGGGGEAHVKGGEVTANGNPVSVNDQGVTVQDKRPIPCPAAPKPPVQVPAPPPPPAVPLPGGLPVGGGSSGSGSGPSGGSSGGTSSGCVPTFDVTYITVYTVAPVKTVDGSHVTIWATGLHIKMTHPSPGPGVPTQSAEYVLGEGFAELQVGTGGAAFDFGGFGGFGAGFGDFGGFGDQTGGPNGPAGSGLSNLGTTLAANRVPLAFLFLTLEALLLAAAAAWVWARNTPADAVPDEVLSP